VVLFVGLNHDAYHGYFQDDEIDNLSWAPFLGPTEFLKGLLSPLYFPNNFRPAGHFYFHAVEAVAGLNFPVYVSVLQALHIVNVWLLWLIVRRLGAAPLAAAAACGFFGLHMAFFQNFWEPMYVFDVLCAGFCLASVWCWLRGQWLLSFAAFWLAYKSKELAVMLPLVLACCEYFFGKRRWKYLIPFFAVSLSFGLQAMVRNPNRNNDYTFRLTMHALRKTVPYYASRVFLVPYAGFAAALLALTVRHRRTWFGLAMMALFLAPLLFLPGRIFSAYCYLPFTGLAIGLSGVPGPALLTAVLLWMPMNIRELRLQRRETLARDSEIRTWMETVQQFAESNQKITTFVYSGAPTDFHPWGIEGALKYFYERQDLVILDAEDPKAAQGASPPPAARIEWSPVTKQATVRRY
jgi:hypothetical protein